MSFGGVSGENIGPHPYTVPLSVRVSKVEPRTVSQRGKFLLEIELKNTGPGIFLFPVSRDFARVQEDQNLGRRSANVSIRFVDRPQPNLDVKVIGLLGGSPSLPRSLKRLKPGDSILIRVTADLSPSGLTQWISTDQREATIRVGYDEYTLKDGEFFVENFSEKIFSQNAVTLSIKKE